MTKFFFVYLDFFFNITKCDRFRGNLQESKSVPLKILYLIVYLNRTSNAPVLKEFFFSFLSRDV